MKHAPLSLPRHHRRAAGPRHAHSCLIALRLGHHLSLPVLDGRPGLGRYQSAPLVELDGPRRRQVLVLLHD